MVVKRTGGQVNIDEKRDIWWHEACSRERAFCPPESVSAEDPLFILYTSGSTGKPKGVVHATAGYLLGTALTLRHVFDVHPDKGDRFACMADVGWITGHSYIVYGPLMNVSRRSCSSRRPSTRRPRDTGDRRHAQAHPVLHCPDFDPSAATPG